MHLAFLTPEYPHPESTSYAGLGTSIKNLAEGLISRDIKVSIFVYGQDEDLEFSEKNINFYFIKQQNYSLFGWYLYRKFLEKFVNNKIEEKGIDALEAPDWTGITAFMNFKCPMVLRLHGSDTYFCTLENRKQKWKNFWLEKQALKRADSLISVSEFTALKTDEYFKLDQSIKVIPNFVDVNKFKPVTTGHKPDSILYFGSIIRKKGILELAEIFNLVIENRPKASLILAGRDVKDAITGISTLELFKNKLSHDARTRFKYLGSLPYPEIQEQISKAAVVVLPSFAEALPMTWLEAMAMEKALVTSNIGWAPEIMINDETGYMVNPKDHDLYARKILEILENDDLNLKFGKSARQRIIQAFSQEKIIEKNIDFYKTIIGSTS